MIIILLYADDTILIADNPTDLQQNLDFFHDYCIRWKLLVNIRKTKIVIFGSRGIPNLNFSYGTHTIEIVDSYKYLGVMFKNTGNFRLALSTIASQAKKALHLLYTRIVNLDLSVNCQILLFNQTIVPILLYGCEIWGFCNVKILEKIQCEFLRFILRVKSSTPHCMLYGETGVQPLIYTIKHRILNFWAKLVNGKSNKISCLLYRILLNDNCINIEHSWMKNVENILNELGLSYVWQSQNVMNMKWFSEAVKQRLSDHARQSWLSTVNDSPKCIIYRCFKTTLDLEPYLSILPISFRIILTKFRTTNHRLPIETGRWSNIERSDRKCTLCDSNTIGDEFHYLFECKFFSVQRSLYIDYHYFSRPNIIKFQQLLSSKNQQKLSNLCKFLRIVMNKFS